MFSCILSFVDYANGEFNLLNEVWVSSASEAT